MSATLIPSGAEQRVYVALVLETGEIDEPYFGPGLAALTADMLLQGSVTRTAQEIAAEEAVLGTKVMVRTGPVSTTVSGEVTMALLPRFLFFLGDLVRHPALDDADFERVKSNAERVLDSTLHNPADLARQRWRAAVFPDSPFGRPYSFAPTLPLLLLGHVRNIFDDNYSASRAHLYVSGVFDTDETERDVREIFGDWLPGEPPAPQHFHAVTGHTLVTADLPGAERSVTWIGLPTIDPTSPDFAKLEVADMLVAGDGDSRVANRLASIEGAPAIGRSSLWVRRHATYWVDVLDVRTANTGAALTALIGELSSLAKAAPPAAEVARAKARVIAAFEARSATREGLASLVEDSDENSLGEDWRAGYVSRVMAVTPEDVRAAVESFLDPRAMTIAIAGDSAAIKPQIEKLRLLVP